jgi:hypothetical protein
VAELLMLRRGDVVGSKLTPAVMSSSTLRASVPALALLVWLFRKLPCGLAAALSYENTKYLPEQCNVDGRKLWIAACSGLP